VVEVLAVIGARSGSRGILDKNIRPLAGKPLMAWIIEASLASNHVGRTIVSTDSKEYAELAVEYGAEVPFLRPDEISTDDSQEIEYVKHAVKWLENEDGYWPDIVVRLQPTNPLQTPDDIDKCIELLLNDPEAASAQVITEARQQPSRALRLFEDGTRGHYLGNFMTGTTVFAQPHNRDTHGKAYFRANVVATRIDVLMRHNSQVGSRIRAHIIPQERALDIDTELDFLVAETIIARDGARLSTLTPPPVYAYAED
jgi:CMP-N,N'-diacetyllegionaminic acid synthase